MAAQHGNISRRRLFEIIGGAALLGGLYSLGFVDRSGPARLRLRAAPRPGSTDLAVVEGGAKDYAAITQRAINELGGIEKFVQPGDRVVISPNIAWMRTPEQAAATHPEVLRAVVQLCERAGAARITCVDYSLDDPKLAFDICGANGAVRGTRATLSSPDNAGMYRDIDLPAAVPRRTLEGTEYQCVHAAHRLVQKLPRELLQADSFICLPVIKDHEAAVMTGALKKLMGLIWNRKDYHRYGLHPCIAELNMALRPTLVVADATRVLQTRGPKGPGEVTQPHKVVAGIDPVAVDSYCTQFLTIKGVTPDAVPHLVQAFELGRGEIDVGRLKVREVAGARGA